MDNGKYPRWEWCFNLKFCDDSFSIYLSRGWNFEFFSPERTFAPILSWILGSTGDVGKYSTVDQFVKFLNPGIGKEQHLIFFSHKDSYFLIFEPKITLSIYYFFRKWKHVWKAVKEKRSEDIVEIETAFTLYLNIKT